MLLVICLLRSHDNEVKQSPLIDRWPLILFEKPWKQSTALAAHVCEILRQRGLDRAHSTLDIVYSWPIVVTSSRYKELWKELPITGVFTFLHVLCPLWANGSAGRPVLKFAANRYSFTSKWFSWMGIVSFDSHCYSVLSWIQWLAYLERAIFKRDLTRQFSNWKG